MQYVDEIQREGTIETAHLINSTNESSMITFLSDLFYHLHILLSFKLEIHKII